ncbi:MAG TPA: hypothetical protein VKR53_02095 [Puia sp.]|nr:hypothetical protein [Puia sp.]
MILNCRVPVYFFISILFFNTLYAQDSISPPTSSSNAIAFYNKFIGEDAHLYNGSEHALYDFRIKGFPYFESNVLQVGFVNYDSILYQQINMAYDIVRDELTINRYNQNFRMTLVNDKIAYFSLLNHYFVRIIQDSLNRATITTGFYDRLYNGKLKLFAKRQKKIIETVTAEEGDKLWFEESDSYFILRNNIYFSIKDKNNLFDFFKDRKKDLKKYLRKNKIKFKDGPETAILKAIEYYDKLKN